MKIRIDDTIYEGTGAEILEQLRLAAFDPTEFPDTESYLWQLRSNFIRMTDRDCVLPKHGLEEQARVLFGELAKIGALEVLEKGCGKAVLRLWEQYQPGSDGPALPRRPGGGTSHIGEL